VSPDQYAELIEELQRTGGATSNALRRRFAAAAYAHTAAYDATIATWFAGQVGEGAAAAAAAAAAAPAAATSAAGAGAEAGATAIVTRSYSRELTLKYGCNPHQAPAFVGSIVASSEGGGSSGSGVPRPLPPAGASGSSGVVDVLPGCMPFAVLNGTPGYINLLDACNAYQLAVELEAATGLAGAASFKHVSPAGAAVAVPLSEGLAGVYEVDASRGPLTPVALAYLRARNADPMCSFGDFAAVSQVVDEATAAILKPEVRQQRPACALQRTAAERTPAWRPQQGATFRHSAPIVNLLAAVIPLPAALAPSPSPPAGQ